VKVMDEEDDCSMANVEKLAMPLLHFLHSVTPQTLIDIVLSPASSQVAKGLLRLATSLPHLHSYSWIEVSLAFVHKIRFHLLSALEEASKREQTKRIDFAKRLFDSLPSNLLEGIERLDPSLSKATLNALHGKDRSFVQSQRTFLDWGREAIMNLGCDHVVSFTCIGVCKF